MFSDTALLRPDHFCDLMERVARFKDKATFGPLFSYYGPRVKPYLLRFCADDVLAEKLAQDAMVIIGRKAEFFNRRQGSVSTWLFRIARKIRNDANGHQMCPELDPIEASLLPREPVAAESLISGAQGDRLVRNAMIDLPEEQKTLLR
jgi:RNA polymerase sigma-70 factor, ECF subfamily